MRPGKRRIKSRQIEEHDGVFRCKSGGEIYEPPIIKKDGFEDDSAIWTRMKQVYFNESGSWKRWLPFYGPTAVREVEVCFPTLSSSSQLSFKLQVSICGDK
jgi:hypothetical protein